MGPKYFLRYGTVFTIENALCAFHSLSYILSTVEKIHISTIFLRRPRAMDVTYNKIFK